MEPSARLAAEVLLTAFVIERIISGAIFIAESWSSRGPSRDVQMRKVVRFIAGAFLAALVVANFKPGVMNLITGVDNGWLDTAVTWFVIIAGSERISEFIGKGDARPAARSETALKVSGTLQAEGEASRAISQGRAA